MNRVVQSSYRHCQHLTRRAASSFYYSFLLLPRQKRLSMCALYAFLRHADDLGDSNEQVGLKQQKLSKWRESLEAALEGKFDSPLLPALIDTVERYQIPSRFLFDVLDGVEMDLVPRCYNSFDELEIYCHRVASAVGIACIHIWGFCDEAAFLPARQCGVAFQLTNILRDVKEDAQRNRIYLPLDDMQRFDCDPEDLMRGEYNPQFEDLILYQVARAEQLYLQAVPLSDYLHRDGQRIFAAMVTIYRGLLDTIKRRRGDVFSRRIRLGGIRKLWIVLSWLVR